MSFLASKVWFFSGGFLLFLPPYFPSPHELAKRVIKVGVIFRKAIKLDSYTIAFITEIILARVPSSKGTKLKLGNVLKNILSWGCS